MVDFHRRKLFCKIKQQFVYRGFCERIVQRFKHVFKGVNLFVAAVHHADVVENLVNKSHGIYRTGRNTIFFLIFFIKVIIEFFSEFSYRRQVRQNYIAA